jgi:hypothetical protein
MVICYMILKILAIVSLCIILIVSLYFLIPNISQLSWRDVPSIVGTAGSVIGLIKQILSELSEKRKKVVLAYDVLLKSNIFQGEWRFQRFANSYYLRIKKTKGETIAEDVRGFITLEGTEVQKIPIKWYMELHPITTIDDYKDLWLFSFEDIKNNSSIWFYHASNQIGEPQIIKNLNEIRDKKLLVKIEGKNARIPNKPFVETIESIMSKAVDMSA